MGLFAVIMIVGALNTFLGQVLAGYKDVARRTLITNFLGSPLTMIFTLGAFAIGWGLGGYIFAQAIAALVVMGFLFWSAWKLTPTPVKRMHSGFPSMESEVISFSAVTFGIAFLEFVIAQADKIIIGFYLNAREVGIYALAATLIGFLPIVLQSVNQIFCPTIAELHARNEHDLLEKIYQTLTKWIVGLTIPLAAVMIVFAPGLMQLFGKEFAGAWPVLVIGTAGQLINCSVGSVGYLLLMSGNQRKLITIQAISGIVMVVLNVKLVPNLGIIGAAIAAATANAFTNLACLLQVRKTLKMFPFRRSYLRLFPSTLASVGTLLLLRVTLDGRLTDGLAIVIGVACAYLVFATVSLLFGLDENDRVIAHAAWAKLSGNLPRMMGASQ
jgi:O-antigen/teichoic acid export membrane protein